jgi:hypothetical protein
MASAIPVQIIRADFSLPSMTCITPGERRAMCGNFIFIVHILHWLTEHGAVFGLTLIQRVEASFNLDWLLGGYEKDMQYGNIKSH